jgi:hypothetical protein
MNNTLNGLNTCLLPTYTSDFVNIARFRVAELLVFGIVHLDCCVIDLQLPTDSVGLVQGGLGVCRLYTYNGEYDISMEIS